MSDPSIELLYHIRVDEEDVWTSEAALIVHHSVQEPIHQSLRESFK